LIKNNLPVLDRVLEKIKEDIIKIKK